MKKTLLPLLVAGLAFAGTRAKDNSNGAVPTTCLNISTGPWVSLSNATGCRMSARTDAGHIAIAGKMVPYYCQKQADGTSIALPTEGAPGTHCTITARLDGGLATGFVCPDLEPLASFGYVAATSYGMTNRDGGADNFILRMECWGPELTGP